jgi:hypothetical protein
LKVRVIKVGQLRFCRTEEVEEKQLLYPGLIEIAES